MGTNIEDEGILLDGSDRKDSMHSPGSPPQGHISKIPVNLIPEISPFLFFLFSGLVYFWIMGDDVT